MNNTLSLEASKLIHSLGVEVEFEKVWINPFKEQGFRIDYKHIWSLNNHHEWFPAYSLQELLSALPAIGEKLGWDTHDPEDHSLEHRCFFRAEKLGGIYFDGGMDAVSFYVISNFK